MSYRRSVQGLLACPHLQAFSAQAANISSPPAVVRTSLETSSSKSHQELAAPGLERFVRRCASIESCKRPYHWRRSLGSLLSDLPKMANSRIASEQYMLHDWSSHPTFVSSFVFVRASIHILTH